MLIDGREERQSTSESVIQLSTIYYPTSRLVTIGLANSSMARLGEREGEHMVCPDLVSHLSIGASGRLAIWM